MEILFIIIIIVSIVARSAKAKTDIDGQSNKKQGMPPFNPGNYPRQMMGGSQPNGNPPRPMSNQGTYTVEVPKTSGMPSSSVPTNTMRPPYSSAKSTTATATTKTSSAYSSSKPYSNSTSKNISSGSTSTKKVAEKREENESVTDFLANKAKKERIQQESDVKSETLKNERFQSGRTSAGRLIYGDPVPNDKRMVVCNYCGAENLVPHYVATHYKCYFCREDI